MGLFSSHSLMDSIRPDSSEVSPLLSTPAPMINSQTERDKTARPKPLRTLFILVLLVL